MRGVIVAEEEGLAARIGLALRLRWPNVELVAAKTARRVKQTLANDAADLVFISTTLSDSDALALVREIRRASDILIFLIGPRGKDSDVAEALEAGADDYVFAANSESLLVARVSANLRRAGRMTVEQEPAVRCGVLAIDPESYEVRLEGKPLYLTPTEFKLVYQLAKHQGRVVTQRALEQAVWGGSDRLYIDVLRKHVQRLRQKLESPRRCGMTITTVPRVGYKLSHRKAARSGR